MESGHGPDNDLTTIAIADAVALLADKSGDEVGARRILVERAQIGDLPASATRAHGPFEGESLNEHDWQIPDYLWQRLGDHSSDEWRRGDLTAAKDTDRYAELSEDYQTPLRLIGVRVNLVAINMIADSLPVDWVNAHDAVDMLSPMFGNEMTMAVAMVLVKRAHSGLLKTRARLFKWEERKRGIYGGSDKIQREAQFAILPKEFWWADGHAALDQNWVTGDFDTWIDDTFHWQAFGTEFDRAGIEAMRPAENLSIQTARAASDPAASKSDVPLPSVPPDDVICAKMVELHNLGVDRDSAAKLIRQIAGFEGVGNEHARRTALGNLPQGRPKK